MKWPPLVNVSAIAARVVTLRDGTECAKDSEAWRAECEARHVLNLPSKQRRRAYLDMVEQRRGADSPKALERLVVLLWQDERALQDSRTGQVA